MQMRTKHLYHLCFPSIPNPRTCHSLPHKPISPIKSGGAPVQRIAEHGALDDGPYGEDGEAAAEDTAVVELAVGEDVPCGAADGEVVSESPAFLQADDVWSRGGGGESAANSGEAGRSGGGDVLEAPAVEGEDVDG